MPRRLPVRPAKVFGNFFVLVVLAIMALIYYTYTFVVWGPKTQTSSIAIPLLIVYNLIFFMLLWSFFQTMTTDPGQVPVFWGFHLGDNENKRRRYCLMCNVFKPERCHHCSACNRCVLNMDHHCPWINNCVGFWNRKYFLLLLIYVLIITYFTLVTMVYDFWLAIQWGFIQKNVGSENVKLKDNILIMISFTMDLIVACLMTAFLKFHIMLASENKTTIENLDKQGKPFKSIYDVGIAENWKQIFGTNPWLYPFPIFCGSGKPIGDGIYWQTIQSQQELAQKQAAQTQEQPKNVSNNPSQNNFSNQGALDPDAKSNQQFILAQQFNRGQNFAPNITMQQQQNNPQNSNIQIIGNQNSNLLAFNNNLPNDSNSKRDLNQRIFQNQGRAQQLQQQLELQKQQQLLQQQPQNNFKSQAPPNLQQNFEQVQNKKISQPQTLQQNNQFQNQQQFQGQNYGNLNYGSSNSVGASNIASLQGLQGNNSSQRGNPQNTGMVNPKKRKPVPPTNGSQGPQNRFR